MRRRKPGDVSECSLGLFLFLFFCVIQESFEQQMAAKKFPGFVFLFRFQVCEGMWIYYHRRTSGNKSTVGTSLILIFIQALCQTCFYFLHPGLWILSAMNTQYLYKCRMGAGGKMSPRQWSFGVFTISAWCGLCSLRSFPHL